MTTYVKRFKFYYIFIIYYYILSLRYLLCHRDPPKHRYLLCHRIPLKARYLLCHRRRWNNRVNFPV